MEEIEDFEEEICEICKGLGEITVITEVWPGEAPVADVGSRPCPCQFIDDYDEEL